MYSHHQTVSSTLAVNRHEFDTITKELNSIPHVHGFYHSAICQASDILVSMQDKPCL